MRYWKFDVVNLLGDFHVNENAVVELKLQLRLAKNEKKNPLVDTDRDMLDRRIAQIECKIQEYQMYVDMVTLGFDVLSEEERKLLEWLYIDKIEPSEAMQKLEIKSSKQLKERVNNAMRNFIKVASPL